MDNHVRELINKLEQDRGLPDLQMKELLTKSGDEDREYLFEKARNLAQKYYNNKVYTRGLIEFSNYCKNDCYYCGIRKSNRNAQRYHLTLKDILECCRQGYELGFRTFVLQGGEDDSYKTQDMVMIISSIRKHFSDCAITLSLGEKSRQVYEEFFDAGADRYLLRHETADDAHYRKLHPEGMSLERRLECLWDLKEIGFQVGTGFMVGSPYQTIDCLLKDFKFIRELQPHMVGIGPFIPHKDTPFAGFEAGTLEMTRLILGILRLMVPYALIPSTTALGTIHPKGREMGILSGANVVMPNLSPIQVRKKYLLYDNKICTGEEAAECRSCLGRRMDSIGYEIEPVRGDCARI